MKWRESEGEGKEEEEEAVEGSGISEKILIKKECKCLFCVIAKKWLSRYNIMSIKRGKERRECEGESEIEGRRVVRRGGC